MLAVSHDQQNPPYYRGHKLQVGASDSIQLHVDQLEGLRAPTLRAPSPNHGDGEPDNILQTFVREVAAMPLVSKLELFLARCEKCSYLYL